MEKEGYWKTKDGRILKISEMSTTHILNCMQLMDDKIVTYINGCMSRNEDYEIPDEYENKMREFQDEILKREKVKT